MPSFAALSAWRDWVAPAVKNTAKGMGALAATTVAKNVVPETRTTPMPEGPGSARRELDRLIANPDAYMRRNYLDPMGNVSGHLFALRDGAQTRYFRRVPLDLFERMKADRQAFPERDDSAIYIEEVLPGTSSRVRVAILPPFRDPSQWKVQFVRKDHLGVGNRPGSSTTAFFGPPEGLSLGLTFGQGGRPTKRDTLLHLSLNTLTGAPAYLGLRQQNTYYSNWRGIELQPMTWNIGASHDLTKSTDFPGLTVKVGNVSVYGITGWRTLTQAQLGLGPGFTGRYLYGKSNAVFEGGVYGYPLHLSWDNPDTSGFPSWKQLRSGVSAGFYLEGQLYPGRTSLSGYRGKLPTVTGLDLFGYGGPDAAFQLQLTNLATSVSTPEALAPAARALLGAGRDALTWLFSRGRSGTPSQPPSQAPTSEGNQEARPAPAQRPQPKPTGPARPAARPSEVLRPPAAPVRQAAGAVPPDTPDAPTAPTAPRTPAGRPEAVQALSEMLPTPGVVDALTRLGRPVRGPVQQLDNLPKLAAQFTRLEALRTTLGPRNWARLGPELDNEHRAARAQLIAVMRDAASEAQQLLSEARALAQTGDTAQAEDSVTRQRLEAIDARLQALQPTLERSFAPLEQAGLYVQPRHPVAAQIEAWLTRPAARPATPAHTPAQTPGPTPKPQAEPPNLPQDLPQPEPQPGPQPQPQPQSVPVPTEPTVTVPQQQPQAEPVPVPPTQPGGPASPAAQPAPVDPAPVETPPAEPVTQPAPATAVPGVVPTPPADADVVPPAQATPEAALEKHVALMGQTAQTRSAMVDWGQALQRLRALPADASDSARRAAFAGLQESAAALQQMLMRPHTAELLWQAAAAAQLDTPLPPAQRALVQALLDPFAQHLAAALGDLAPPELSAPATERPRELDLALLALLSGTAAPQSSAGWLVQGTEGGLLPWLQGLAAIDPGHPNAAVTGALPGTPAGTWADFLLRSLHHLAAPLSAPEPQHH